MYYQYIKGIKREKFSVEKVDEILLEELPERDQMIIRHDWEKIARYVKREKHTNYQNETLCILVLLEKEVAEMRK